MTLTRSCLPFEPAPTPAADAGVAPTAGTTDPDAIGADLCGAASVPDALAAGVMRQVEIVASDVTIQARMMYARGACACRGQRPHPTSFRSSPSSCNLHGLPKSANRASKLSMHLRKMEWMYLTTSNSPFLTCWTNHTTGRQTPSRAHGLSNPALEANGRPLRRTMTPTYINEGSAASSDGPVSPRQRYLL